MACSSCRKPPRVVRKPSVTNPSGSSSPSVTKKDNGANSQRDKIVGLKYVPKD